MANVVTLLSLVVVVASAVVVCFQGGWVDNTKLLFYLFDSFVFALTLLVAANQWDKSIVLLVLKHYATCSSVTQRKFAVVYIRFINPFRMGHLGVISIPWVI